MSIYSTLHRLVGSSLLWQFAGTKHFHQNWQHGSLSEASSASVRGVDSETQFFRYPWPSPLGPDLVSAASQESFPVLFCFKIGASEPGLSQWTHFSFAAETGEWSFLSPSPGTGSDPEEKHQRMGLRHGHSYVGASEAIKTVLLLPWTLQTPRRGSHNFLVL